MPFHVREELPSLQTIVVKVGSRILSADQHLERTKRLKNLVDDITKLRDRGIQIVLVSSGAIAHGMRALGLDTRPRTIPMQQACASIGQIRLMHMYETLFAQHDTVIGQVLLTWDDLRVKKRYLNLRNTLFMLLESGAVPIVNENDSVGVDEIRFGDNDTLGAQIAMLVGADLFVNLTDINGLYEANPRLYPEAAHIPLVKRVSSAVHRLADSKGSAEGVGGMVTKLRAAEMVTRTGIHAIIGDGFTKGLLTVLRDPQTGTLFLPSKKIMCSKARWIAFTSKSHGRLIIDTGAGDALKNKGKSLLPAGVKSVDGSFKIGDMVDIVSENGEIVARGLSNYSAKEISQIMGRRSSEITSILGQKTFDEIIHRDNLVLIG
ncbi:MAG: glutamate 5-kinase [Fibrobacterota bacterium]